MYWLIGVTLSETTQLICDILLLHQPAYTKISIPVPAPEVHRLAI
jgi:hypothetical protein